MWVFSWSNYLNCETFFYPFPGSQASGTSEVKSETGPCTRRARRHQRKKQATPDRQVAGVMSKRTYIQGLSWAARRGVDLHPTCQNLKSLYRGLNSVQSHIPSRRSYQHIALSQGCILENSSHCGNGGHNTHSKARGGDVEPLIAQILLKGPLIVMSSWWLSLTLFNFNISVCQHHLDFLKENIMQWGKSSICN